MSIFISLGDFLLSKWLWSMTFDWYHLFINLFLMAFLFRGMSHSSYWRALVLSFILQLFAFALFTGVVVGILYYTLGWEYVMPEVAQLPLANYVMRACLALGVIYAVAQTIFVFAWHLYAPVRLMPYLVIIWMGNFISTIISYCCILAMNSLML